MRRWFLYEKMVHLPPLPVAQHRKSPIFQPNISSHERKQFIWYIFPTLLHSYGVCVHTRMHMESYLSHENWQQHSTHGIYWLKWLLPFDDRITNFRFVQFFPRKCAGTEKRIQWMAPVLFLCVAYLYAIKTMLFQWFSNTLSISISSMWVYAMIAVSINLRDKLHHLQFHCAAIVANQHQQYFN